MTVADVKRVQWSPFKVDELILTTAMEDVSKYGRHKYEIWIEQEGGGSGKRDIAHLLRQLAGYTAKPDKVGKDKYERARPVSAYAEAGNVEVVDTFWTDPFLEEIDFFPDNTEHDDQVDVLSGLYNCLYPVGKGHARPRFDIIQI